MGLNGRKTQRLNLHELTAPGAPMSFARKRVRRSRGDDEHLQMNVE